MKELNKYWTEKFNSLPDEIRHIACASSAFDQINHLKREKMRLKKRYDQSIGEINSHIKSIESDIKSEFKKEVT